MQKSQLVVGKKGLVAAPGVRHSAVLDGSAYFNHSVDVRGQNWAGRFTRNSGQ